MRRSFSFVAVASAVVLTGCASTNGVAPVPQIRMYVVDEADVISEEAPPHGAIGMSTAYRISDAAADRTMEFRKRALHPGAAIGAHVISHDEVYYVVSGEGVVESDGETATLTEGMAAYLYAGADVGIRQVGDELLVLIISYPLPGHPRLKAKAP